MTEAELAHVDATLLLIAEARDRAERAIRELGGSQLVAALDAAERDLLAVHNQLHRAVYFPSTGETQLKLAG
ncbi:MAG: hypothetical protein ACYDA3_09075 [Gaiellaceae bacterium]